MAILASQALLAGVPPLAEPSLGTPQLDLAGVPPSGAGRGTPHTRCGQSENITFPHPSDAVGKNVTSVSVAPRTSATWIRCSALWGMCESNGVIRP